MTLPDIFSDIEDARTWKTVEAVNKGWSTDRKYYVQTIDGRKLLVRVSDISQYEVKQQEFEAVRKLESMEITRKPWAEHYNQKINRYISNYKACGIKFKGAGRIIDFIEQNRYLLEGRPQSFQHGDYHVGNMIITNSGQLGIIDFNRYDYGDPWEEFNRITFCSGLSALFGSGRINGYFKNDVPELFFRVMALYIASNQISSISWAIPFGQAEVDNMLERAEVVLDGYDGFQSCVPKWYIADF